MSTAASQHDEPTTGLNRPQFGLRTLLLVVTLLCVLFAVMIVIGPLWSAVLILFLVLVGGHVAGNALGTTLRDHSSADCVANAARRRKEGQPGTGSLAPPGERLRERACVGRGMLLATSLGAVAGAAIGGSVLIATNSHSIGAAGLGVGALSSGVLGGFVGFLAGSFLCVAYRALTEALGRHDSTVQRRP